MTIDELAREYEGQYKALCAKLDGLRPLLYVYGGKELYELRKKIKIYYNMACECKCTSALLSRYYDEEDDIDD